MIRLLVVSTLLLFSISNPSVAAQVCADIVKIHAEPTEQEIEALGKDKATEYRQLLIRRQQLESVPKGFYQFLAEKTLSFPSQGYTIAHGFNLALKKTIQSGGGEVKFELDKESEHTSPWMTRYNQLIAQGYIGSEELMSAIEVNQILHTIEAIEVFDLAKDIDSEWLIQELLNQNLYKNLSKENAKESKTPPLVRLRKIARSYSQPIVKKHHGDLEKTFEDLKKLIPFGIFKARSGFGIAANPLDPNNISKSAEQVAQKIFGATITRYTRWEQSLYGTHRALMRDPKFIEIFFESLGVELSAEDASSYQFLTEYIMPTVGNPGALAQNIQQRLERDLESQIKPLERTLRKAAEKANAVNQTTTVVTPQPLQSQRIKPEKTVSQEPTGRKRKHRNSSAARSSRPNTTAEQKATITEQNISFDTITSIDQIVAGKTYTVQVMRKGPFEDYIQFEFSESALRKFSKIAPQHQSMLLRAISKGYSRNSAGAGGFEEGLRKMVTGDATWELRAMCDSRVVAKQTFTDDGVFHFEFIDLKDHKTL